MNLAQISRRLEIAFWMALVAALRSQRLGRFLTQAGIFIACGLVLAATTAILPRLTPSKTEVAVVAQPQQAGQPVVPANGQRNLLTILVDDFSAAHPQLRGVWLVARAPYMPQVTFLPVYPLDDLAAVPVQRKLKESFQLQIGGGLPSEFVQELQSRGLWWHNYLIIDEAGLVRLIDALGGIDLGDDLLGGKQALAQTLSAQDSASILEVQARLARAICSRSAQRWKAGETTSAARLFGGVLSDLSPDDLLTAWRGALQSGGFACEFPTIYGR